MTSRPIPYPPNTRAKGWRFEIDHERIRQSDTWALTHAEARPWLLMLWMVAWEQTPIGSLPDDEDVIRAKLEMPEKLFQKHKSKLLRKWWKADDGRLYHDVIVERVQGMLDWKQSERERKAAYRAKTSGNVPRDKQGTDTGQTEDSHGKDDTRTRTRTNISLDTSGDNKHAFPVKRDESAPSPEGISCKVMIDAGIDPASVNPSHPKLRALIVDGATPEEFANAAREAVAKGSKKFSYVLGIVGGRREDASKLKLHHGGRMPPSDDFQNRDYGEGGLL